MSLDFFFHIVILRFLMLSALNELCNNLSHFEKLKVKFLMAYCINDTGHFTDSKMWRTGYCFNNT